MELDLVKIFSYKAFLLLVELLLWYCFHQIRASDIWRESQHEDLLHHLLDYHLKITMRGTDFDPPPIKFEGSTDDSQLDIHFEIGYSGTLICTDVCTQTHCNLISSPDPTLKEGKGSGELWVNPRFLCYDAHWQGHVTLGSDWSAQLHSYNNVAFPLWASHATVPELRSVGIPLHRPKDSAKFTRPFSLLKDRVWGMRLTFINLVVGVGSTWFMLHVHYQPLL